MGHENRDLQIRIGKGGNFPGNDLPVLYPGGGQVETKFASLIRRWRRKWRHKTSVVKSCMISIYYRNSETI